MKEGPTHLRFSTYEADLRTSELRNGETRIKLAPQAFQILVLLAQRQGELVTREEIRQVLWPDETVVEFEHSINTAVKRIRDVLNDNASAPRYLETLPRRGYRFIAPVVIISGTHAPPLVESIPEQPPIRSVAEPALPPVPATSGVLWKAVAATAVIAAGVGVTGTWLASRSIPLPPLVPEILTSDPGVQLSADFSPDGKQIVYSWNGYQEKNFDIYVLTLGSGQPARRATVEPNAEYSPRWSPDGRFIAYLEGPVGGPATLMVIPAEGGQARKVADTDMKVEVKTTSLAWSRDSRFIFVQGRGSAQQSTRLGAVSIETGENRGLTTPAANQNDMQPAVSPDGRMLAYIKDVGNGVSIPYLLALTPEWTADGESQRVEIAGFPNALTSFPAWLSNSDLLVTSNRGGIHHFWRISTKSPASAALERVLGDNVAFPTISPDGRRLVYSRFASDATLWSAPTDPAGGSPQRWEGAMPSDFPPEVSPDGSRIVFESERSGSSEIWLANADGSQPRQLTSYGGPITGSGRWSPDGSLIAFDSRVEGQPDIYLMPSAGGPTRRLTNDPAADVMPSWSPDGRWVYFCSGRSGSRQVWRAPAAGGAAEQITKQGGCAALPSADGKTLFYLKERAPLSPLWKVAAEGGEETLVVNNVVERCFVPATAGLYYAAQDSNQALPSLRYLDLTTGETKTVLNLSAQLGRGLSLSKDGGMLIYRQLNRQSANLMLVNNFR